MTSEKQVLFFSPVLFSWYCSNHPPCRIFWRWHVWLHTWKHPLWPDGQCVSSGWMSHRTRTTPPWRTCMLWTTEGHESTSHIRLVLGMFRALALLSHTPAHTRVKHLMNNHPHPCARPATSSGCVIVKSSVLCIFYLNEPLTTSLLKHFCLQVEILCLQATGAVCHEQKISVHSYYFLLSINFSHI